MDAAAKIGSPPVRTLPEALARSLRHEVGDLLQTVYATVAILQKRLPEDLTLERRLLADMRARAEGCKHRLDAIHDLVCSLSYSEQPVDLAEVAAALVAGAAARYPQLAIKAEAVGRPTILADASRISQLGENLLANACEAAQARVTFRTHQEPAEQGGEWEITDDGPGVPAERLSQIFLPFFTTRHGHLGVGLPLAEKFAAAHGGCVSAENLPEGGFRVRVTLPGGK